jgi:hypothetical protein
VSFDFAIALLRSNRAIKPGNATTPLPCSARESPDNRHHGDDLDRFARAVALGDDSIDEETPAVCYDHGRYAVWP